MSLSLKQPILLAAVLFLIVGCSSSQPPAAKREAPPAAPSSDEAAAITVARRAVEANDTWAEKAKFEPKRDGEGWSVMVWRVEAYDKDGRPLIAPGAHRLVRIDKNGNVTAYMRGE